MRKELVVLVAHGLGLDTLHGDVVPAVSGLTGGNHHSQGLHILLLGLIHLVFQDLQILGVVARWIPMVRILFRTRVSDWSSCISRLIICSHAFTVVILSARTSLSLRILYGALLLVKVVL